MPGPSRPNPRGAPAQSFTITPEYSITLPGNSGPRGSEIPNLIILHNTDSYNKTGNDDLKSVEATLRDRNLSVHIVNDGEGKCARLCPDDIIADHAQGWNTQSLGIEQVSRIGQPTSSYSAAQIDNTAKWIAHWSKKYDIPIKRSNSYGICSHSETKGNPSGTDCMTGAYPWSEVLQKAASYSGKVVEGDPNSLDGSGSSESGGGGVDAAAAETAFKATSFATYLQLPGVLEGATSISLKGERSLMNDQPLLPFIIQLTQACLRNFQSLPDGSFFAFYPDYFGGQNHRTPYWDISDIEIIEGQIQLSDDALATHVYVVGDTVGNFDGVNIEDMVQSQGVVTLFNAFLADFINPVAFEKQNVDKKDAKAEAIKNFIGLADKDNAIAFLQKYGARPHYDAAPMVRSKFYEGFLAYQTFCLLWSRQLTSNFIFTFMPEVFPGGIVRFPNHGLQMYVDEVSHTFDYATGFETHAVLIAPASTETDRSKYPIHEGMIRAGAMAAPKP